MNAVSKPRPAWADFPPIPRLPDLREAIDPYPFQDATIAKAAPMPKFAIGAATGLGKTFMSYEVAKRFRREHPRTRFFFLTNKSAALQFAGEHAKFYSSDLAITAVYDGMPKLGQRVYADTRARAYEMFGDTSGGPAFDALVLNYHLFRSDIEPILAQVERLRDAGWGVALIPDEATAFKNEETITHRAVHALSALSPKIVILTATLTKGKLEEFWGIFAGIGLSHVIAPSRQAFLERYCITTAVRAAILPAAKLDEVYYYVVTNRLDGGVFLGLRAFYRFYNVKRAKGAARLGKRDLDDIHELCLRSPGFAAAVPNRQAFYDRIGAGFEEPDPKKEPVITGYKRIEEFISRVAPYLMILRKSDVADFLPPFVPRKVWLSETAEQRHLIGSIYAGEIRTGDYAEWRGDLTDDEDSGRDVADGVVPVERITEQGHIRRALLDPRLVHKQRLDDLSPKSYPPKTEELVRFLLDEATGEKVIVYTPSKVHLKLLAATLREVDGLLPCYRNPLEIHGDVSAPQREDARIAFQTSDLSSLILLNDAGLESLNLQAASILVVMGMPRSGGDMIQLAGRLSRLGSKHVSLMLLFLMMRGTQDEDDYDVIQRQMQVAALIHGEAEKGLLDHDRLRDMDGIDEDVPAEEYRRATLARLVLSRRPRRVKAYGRVPAPPPGARGAAISPTPHRGRR